MEDQPTIEELKTRYSMIPEHMLHGIIGYRDHGHYLGSFGEALLSCQMIRAVCKADEGNQRALVQWVKLLVNDMPHESYGSPKAYNAWVKKGGLNGKDHS